MRITFKHIAFLLATGLFLFGNGEVIGSSYYANTESNTESNIQTTIFTDSQSNEIVISNPINKNFIVQIFDLTGNELFKQEFPSNNNIIRISSNQLKPGIYLIKVTPAVSAPSVTAKIIFK